MSWFGEQLEERKTKDNELFEGAFQDLSSVVMPSAGRQKMEEIVRQHQEAETNGTDEENGGFSVASLKRENGLADATQEITVDKKGAGADKSANANANNKKNKGNNNSQAVENTQTGQETGQAGTQTPAEPTPSEPVQQPDAGSGDGEDIGWTDGVL